MFIVFLRAKQKVAPDRWVTKFCKVAEKELHVSNKKTKVNVLKLMFVPPADLRASGGGHFTIEGEGFPKSRACCLKHLQAPPEANMMPLVPYSDDESLNAASGSSDEEEEPDQVQAPAGAEVQHHEDAVSEGGGQTEEEQSDLDLGFEDAGWERGPAISDVSKEKKFHVSEEYKVLEKEGFVEMLPNVVGCGLGRHSAGAWSAHYPSEGGGCNYVSRRWVTDLLLFLPNAVTVQ